MLQVRDLQVQYDDFIAVSSASLSLEAGRVAALIGANGAGKSSLMSAVAGLLRPSSGRVFFQGEDITSLPADQVVRRGLCLVPQGGRCFQRMSVEDNLLVGSYPKPARPRRNDTLDLVYTLFPVLKTKRKDLAGTLSGGQRQMVAIGRALMSGPRCLLFDEISLGLAPVVIQEIYASIRQINRERNTTVLLVEQDTNRALQMSDFSFFMLEGKISLSGPSAQMTPEQVRGAYFGQSLASNPAAPAPSGQSPATAAPSGKEAH